MDKIYDYIIIGSGVAGNVCAFCLQKKGFSCLILEKEEKRREKICGGGIPRKALNLLDDIGMNIQKLLALDVSVINGDSSFINEHYVENYYTPNCSAIACRRVVFDSFLLGEAVNAGAKIAWGENVNKIGFKNNTYKVNGYASRKVIVAIGARGFENRYYEGQSVGISTQICGDSDLKNDMFYYYYYKNTDARYFWIFPIGNKLWNIGIWFRKPTSEMMKEYEECWKRYVEGTFRGYTYVQKPSAEFCGNIDLGKKEQIIVDAIGDFAGMNNIKNGGGIYRAIKSAIQCSNCKIM